MTKTIEELYQKTIDFSPTEIDLTDCLTSLNIDNKVYDDLDHLLKNS